MSEPAIRIRDLSKCYRLGAINRHTLVEETQYWWHRLRGRDPRALMGRVGHNETERRKVEAERRGAQEFWALRDVSFDVQPGEVIGVIGRNGAGKSTLLKLLTRITEPTSGRIEVRGRVASLLEVGTGFHPELTGRENIYMNGTILGMKKREIDRRLDEIIAFSELATFIDTPVKRYSSGMYVRLAFSVAAHLEPEIMLVDEVLAVGDAAFQAKCLGRMGKVAQEGRTILFVSHNMPAVQNLCPRCVLIRDGRLHLDGDTPSVMKAYLGMASANHAAGRDLTDPSLQRSGSGLARLVRADLLAADGQPLALVPMGEGLRIRLTVRPETDIADAVFAGAIVDAQGGTVCQLNSADTAAATFRLRAGIPVVVEATVAALNLMPGRYQLNLGLTTVTGRARYLDHVAGAIGFDVVPANVFGTGRIPKGAAAVYYAVQWRQLP